MIVDIIILACSKTTELIKMTQACIDSLHASEPLHRFNVLVIEAHVQPYLYKGAMCVRPGQDFNYNKFMNIGIDSSQHEWICMANNDLLFKRGWFSAILQASQELPEVKSFCSFAKQHVDANMSEPYYVRYGVGGFVCGWCITVKREIFTKFRLNEEVNFWCSDNIYQDQLIEHGIKHALIRDSYVEHLGGVTLFTMPQDKIHEFTARQAEIYASINTRK